MATMAAILKNIFRFFSWTKGPVDLKLDRKKQGDL